MTPAQLADADSAIELAKLLGAICVLLVIAHVLLIRAHAPKRNCFDDRDEG